jgi:hypothetical protein
VGLPGGGFVVAWQSETETLARLFDTTGAALGTPILVSPNGADQVSDNADRVDVESSPAGGFWIAWVMNAGANEELRLRKYDASGTLVGAEILVDSASYLGGPKLAADVDGKVFLTWGQLDAHGVRGKLFAADGSELSAETRLMPDALASFGTPIAIGPGEFVAPSLPFNRDGVTLCDFTPAIAAVALERFCSDDAPSCTLCPGVSNDADADVDGIPDACDRCTVLDPGQQIAFSSLEFIERPFNSGRPDRFRARGSFVSRAPLAAFEPETQGLRVTMDSADFGNVVNWTLAGGPLETAGEGWRVNAARSKWVYRNLKPISSCTIGVNTMMLKHRASDPPGFLSFKMSGKKVPKGCLERALTETDLPLAITIAVANQTAAIDGACGEGSLENLSCTFSGPTFEEIVCLTAIEPVELICR